MPESNDVLNILFDDDRVDELRTDLMMLSDTLDDIINRMKDDPEFLARNADTVVRVHNTACQTIVTLGQTIT